MAVADGPAADEVDRFVIAKSPVAGRRVKFVAVAVQHFEADRIQRPHLAARGLVIAVHGFQATAVGQAGEFLPHVRLDPRQQQHARRQILRPRRQRDSQSGTDDSNDKPHGNAVSMIQFPGKGEAGAAAGPVAYRQAIIGEPVPVKKPSPGALLLGLIPFAAMCFSVALWDRVDPMILGLPFNLAWLICWIVLSTLVHVGRIPRGSRAG